jgi:aryl-alcohol dehydrogenase-like predicted oxidoreductase
MKRSGDGSIIGRREFLKRGVLAGVGVSILPLAGSASASLEAAPRIRRYSTLGRTGLKISDISFGASRLTSGNEDLVRHAYDCGVNYFDSADSYTDGESETTVGNALKGKRDKVFLTSKQMAQADDKRDAMMETLEGSLRRLQTDHVDVYFNHAVNDPARLKNPEWHEFTVQARKQGKIRFVGMSGHAGNLAECLDYAIDNNQVDVILCAHNFGPSCRVSCKKPISMASAWW